MSKIILIVAPVTLAYLVLAWFTGSFLGLQGLSLLILRIALSLIGIAAAAIVVWFLAKKKKEEQQAAAGDEEAQESSEEIAVLIREAEKKLSSAQLEKGAPDRESARYPASRRNVQCQNQHCVELGA